jgi:REP element-mobilizing transposase RayT
MSRSLAFVLVHVIFSTKERRPVLDDVLRPELYAYLSTLVRNAGCECYRVGGVADHVHLGIRMSRTTNVAKLVEGMKASSSKWIKTKETKFATFAWQRGYGAFSVGPADLNALVQYIDSQDEHHAKRTFQEEFRGFLKRYGIECEERYLWD